MDIKIHSLQYILWTYYKNIMKCIYLSRHGESMYNKEDRIGGDPNLSPNGYAYSRILSNHINKLDIGFVMTSELIRTIETAQSIIHPKISMSELNEIHSGICENLTYDEVRIKYPEIYAARSDDKYNYRYPQGESYDDLLIRLKPIFDLIDRSTGPILIIAHQAVLRVIYGVLMDMDKYSFPHISIPLHTLIQLNISKDHKSESIELIM